MKIFIYSTKACPYCKQEKKYFDEKGVEYINYFVDDDVEKAREMKEKSGQLGVPFTVIQTDDGEEHTVLGFDQEKLDELLEV